jgi:hypothetical protein
LRYDAYSSPNSLSSNPSSWDLDWRIDEAARYKELFVDWMGDVQMQNMHNITKAVEDYESQIEIAKFVRDTSADGLMVGASVMSGGAALAFTGAGSFLKGTAMFQDTGSVGAGVMEGVGSFVFAYVKLGKTFSLKQDMVLALVQAPYKTGTELAGGASFGRAALIGALKLTGPFVPLVCLGGPCPWRLLLQAGTRTQGRTGEGPKARSPLLGQLGGRVVLLRRHRRLQPIRRGVQQDQEREATRRHPRGHEEGPIPVGQGGPGHLVGLVALRLEYRGTRRGQQTAPTQVDVWLGSRIKLEDVRIPANVEVVSGGEIEKFVGKRQKK